jgi:hypothetical protein
VHESTYTVLGRRARVEEVSMSGVFISYRRSDASAYANLLHDWISERYGDERVFTDIDAIEHGVYFAKEMDERIASSEVVIVVIGKEWLVEAQGRRRLDDPDDYVRLEIAAALKQDIRVIPVLVEGATMPSSEELPEALRGLARRQALEMSDVRLRSNKEVLLEQLDRILGESAPEPAAAMHVPAVPPKRARRRVRNFSFGWRRMIRPSGAPPRPSIDQLARKRDEGRSEPVRASFEHAVRPPHDRPAVEVGDTVDCTVFAPKGAAPGDVIFVQVFAHLVEQADEARVLAEEFDADAERRAFKTLEAIVRRGSTLALDLRMRRLTVTDAVQSLVWRGRPEAVQFEVEVPEDARPGTDIGTVTVSLDSVPIGHVKFKLAIVSAEVHPTWQSEPVGDDAKRYTSAFVSYSAKDRRKVLERVQMLKPLGIHYFQDLLDLDPGDRWEQKLYLSIRECDLFLLFWSSEAKASHWVRKEVGYALDRKGGDDFAAPEIRPVIIEGPPIPDPWPELAHLHFGDRFVYLMAGVGS